MATVRDIKTEFETLFPKHNQMGLYSYEFQLVLIEFWQKLNNLGGRAIDRVRETTDIDSLVELTPDECSQLRAEMGNIPKKGSNNDQV